MTLPLSYMRPHKVRHSICILNFSLFLGMSIVGILSSYFDLVLLQRTSCASATVAQRASIESLFEQANLIMRVHVLQTWSPKTRGSRGEIYTYTRLKPIEVWHGELETSEVLLVQLGGQIGDLRLEVHGDAELKEGQEVVLFLRRSNDAPPVPMIRLEGDQGNETTDIHQVVHLVSLAQGAFHVDRSKAHHTALLYQDLDGIVFYAPHTTKLKLGYTPVKSTPRPTLTLKALKEKVSTLSAHSQTVEARQAEIPFPNETLGAP